MAVMAACRDAACCSEWAGAPRAAGGFGRFRGDTCAPDLEAGFLPRPTTGRAVTPLPTRLAVTPGLGVTFALLLMGRGAGRLDLAPEALRAGPEAFFLTKMPS